MLLTFLSLVGFLLLVVVVCLALTIRNLNRTNSNLACSYLPVCSQASAGSGGAGSAPGHEPQVYPGALILEPTKPAEEIWNLMLERTDK